MPDKPSVAKKTNATKHKIDVGGGGNASMKILNTLAANKVKRGQDAVEKKKLGGLSKVPGASTVRKALAKLTKDGWIKVASGNVMITDLGMKHANADAVVIPTSNKEFQAKIKASLKDKQAAVFEQIEDGRVHSKTMVMEAVGMQKNSTWRKLLGALAKDNIIEHSGDNIQLAKRMFPIVARPE